MKNILGFEKDDITFFIKNKTNVVIPFVWVMLLYDSYKH
jgi:hypothetical protein